MAARHSISAEGRNQTIDFDESCFVLPENCSDEQIAVFTAECMKQAAHTIKQVASLVSLVESIDLTTLNGDDTPAIVYKLTNRALSPLGPDALKAVGETHKPVTCAAVCVYPARVRDVIHALSNSELAKTSPIGVASTAGGFPSGQYRIESRLLEIKLAIEDGANEIDTVINRCAALTGHWKEVYQELVAMRKECGNAAHLKTILATGELVSKERIYTASWCAMLAGSDFIKTSTGKESVNATLAVAYVMCQAIHQFHIKTAIKIGFKPAGGIKTPTEALAYRILVEKICGKEWMTPELFRIGASSLLDVVEKALID